ncbi:MAG: glycoside hydrolase family 97 protein [Planctomycetota bacterium]
MNRLNRHFVRSYLLAAFVVGVAFSGVSVAGEPSTVSSPDGRIAAQLHTEPRLTYSVTLDATPVLVRSPIGLELRGIDPPTRIDSVVSRQERSRYEPVVPRKHREIEDLYNERAFTFDNGLGLVLRAYDDGVAYRWTTDLEGQQVVMNETATFEFPSDAKVWWPRAEGLQTSHEPRIAETTLTSLTSDDLAFCGVLVGLGEACKVLIGESDLRAYPGMMVAGSDDASHRLQARFAAYPTVTQREDERYLRVAQRSSEIARIDGRRSLPWRAIVIAENDTDLVNSVLIDKLSMACQIEDTSWVKPGRVAWDWWNELNLHGVDFQAGLNTETYRRYIDFAAENKLEYVILDEGWTNLGDLTDYNPDIDVRALIDYGRERGVGVILWSLWRDLLIDLEGALDRFESWGVAGLKIDFIDRDDQLAVESVWEITRLAAERELLVNFHGCYKPAGLRRAYPNSITREGVLGLEVSKWDRHVTPEHDLVLPFTRMVLGPMDYTPGAMRNAQPKNFEPIYSRPMSQGTRCHQLAMYVCYESPLQMLCDTPSNYRDQPETLAFLRQAPTVWDETRVLAGKVGDHLAIARRHGTNWYVGAMAGADARELDLRLPFLGDRDWSARIWEDGPNATRQAEDFARRETAVGPIEPIRVRMAPGGGWVAIIEPINGDDAASD